MSKYHMVKDLEIIWEREEDDPSVRYIDREVDLYDLDNYLFDKFEAWWKFEHPGKEAQPIDFSSFVRFHSDLAKKYILRHGYAVRA